MSGASWLVEEVEGGPAELWEASGSRGVAGSHGGSRRWRRLRSGEENRGGGECSGERMRTRKSEEERQGGAWRLRASRRKQEVAEASRARATPRLCPSGEGGRRQGRGWRWAGPAGPVGGAR